MARAKRLRSSFSTIEVTRAEECVSGFYVLQRLAKSISQIDEKIIAPTIPMYTRRAEQLLQNGAIADRYVEMCTYSYSRDLLEAWSSSLRTEPDSKLDAFVKEYIHCLLTSLEQYMQLRKDNAQSYESALEVLKSYSKLYSEQAENWRKRCSSVVDNDELKAQCDIRIGHCDRMADVLRSFIQKFSSD